MNCWERFGYYPLVVPPTLFDKLKGMPEYHRQIDAGEIIPSLPLPKWADDISNRVPLDPDGD